MTEPGARGNKCFVGQKVRRDYRQGVRVSDAATGSLHSARYMANRGPGKGGSWSCSRVTERTRPQALAEVQADIDAGSSAEVEAVARPRAKGVISPCASDAVEVCEAVPDGVLRHGSSESLASATVIALKLLPALLRLCGFRGERSGENVGFMWRAGEETLFS